MSQAAGDRSVAALRKADKFSAENDVGRRVQAKQAILQELNTQLKSRSERLKSQYSAAAGTEPASCSHSGHSPRRIRFNVNSIHLLWDKLTTLIHHHQRSAWCSGNASDPISEVTVRRARLILRWVMWAGKPSRDVTNRLGQLSLPSLRGR